MKIDILAIGAHPDDVEIGCAGTIAKEISHGQTVGILDLTRGELGTRGTAKIRAEEARNAADILQVSFRLNTEFKDGFFVNDAAHQLEIIKILRKYQPNIVLCNAMDDRHIDHPKGSALVSHACFLSGLQKIQTKHNNQNQAPWRPQQIYHYIQWKTIIPDFVVDISDFMDIKNKSILAYKSQFYNVESTEPKTPISTKNFLDSITYRAADLGRIVDVSHAEGFTAERYLAVKSLTNLF